MLNAPTDHWQTFLAQQGATVDTENHTVFSDAPTTINNDVTYLTNLSHQSLLSIAGPDAVKFLQGQITCDVNDINKGICPQGAQCNLKGRVIGNFRIAATKDSDNLFMRMHNSTLPAVYETLKKYSVFSKLAITNESNNWQRFGIFGPKAGEHLKNISNTVLANSNTYQPSESLIVLKLSDTRYECWVKNDKAEDLWQALADKCTRCNSRFWSLLDIQAGWVEVQQTTSALFTPQALNLSLIDAVSFKKGCYTGQEVVARLHYKATLKKHTHRLLLHCDESPKPLTPIANELDVKQGEIISAAPLAPGLFEALAILPVNCTDTLFLADSGKSIERLALPYAIPKAE